MNTGSHPESLGTGDQRGSGLAATTEDDPTTTDTLPDVRVFPDRLALGQAAAEEIARELEIALGQAPTVRVVFAAAASQEETLATLTKTDGIDWSRIDAFHMDEYLGLPPDHPSGFANWLQARLFSLVPFHSVNLIEPGTDPDKVAENYAALLNLAPVDLVVCGIGQNGHIAFNDPPVADFADPLDAKGVQLDETCRRQQVDDGGFDTFEDVPTHAITLTIPELLRARTIICIVPGANKRQAVTAALTGPITTQCPASLRTHQDVRMFLDSESGADVTG